MFVPSAEIVYGPSGDDKEQENENRCQGNVFFAQGLVNGEEEVFTPDTSIAHVTSAVVFTHVHQVDALSMQAVAVHVRAALGD